MSCGIRHGRYDVGFIDWRQQPIEFIESKLSWMAPLLAPTSVLVVWLDAGDISKRRKLGSSLGKHGFRVEVGTVCELGFAISARRRDAHQQALAA
jgi:hypothetical protein